MTFKHWLTAALAAALLVAASAASAQAQHAQPARTGINVFDNGSISRLDPAVFNFKREELREVDFVNASYLIVHPRGTVMVDSGGIPDGDFKADGGPVTEGIMTARKPLLPQLAAAGYAPRDVTYFVMSHYHSNHTANANQFASATWIVQKAERDFMFGEGPQGIIQPATYAALRNAKTKTLDNEDFDGDLYHYPEERTTGRTPTFEFDAAQSKLSRARVEQYLKDSNATLWIEHDLATHAALPKSPQFLD